MRKYTVLLVRQELVSGPHRTDRRDLHEEIHRIKARNAKEAIAEAKDLVSWINKRLLRSIERVQLREVRNSRGKCIWSHLFSA